jgi:pimeloyl-ACP methyl ester carboxylesterase
VLLCNPFGEEAARAHRIYRVLATRLERAGYMTLRFDYGATGDSMGDTVDGTIERWIGDIGVAARTLAAQSNAQRLVAVGLRLGGTLAALAAAKGGVKLRHLVLWDPVVDGGAYLGELGAAHRRYMDAEMGEGRAVADGEGMTEALGTPITAALAAGMRGIDLAATELRADHLTVVSTAREEAGSLAQLRQKVAGRAGARWLALPDSAAWETDAALNAQVVPMDAVQAIVERIEEISP